MPCTRSGSPTLPAGPASCTSASKSLPFAEARNLAALLGAPVLFLVADRKLDGRAPIGPQSAAGAEALASAHGLPVTTADGHDASAVHAAVREALDAGGPAVILSTISPGAPS